MKEEQLLFFTPYCKDVVWGGDRLRTLYGYETPSDRTGEAWVLSAVGESWLTDADNRAPYPYPGESVVTGGVYDGEPLSRLWAKHRELFGGIQGDSFPLLIKLIDAKEDLSIQVHPDDDYARTHEDAPCGKNECWLILDTPPDGDIVIGHHAQTSEELRHLVDAGAWERLLSVQPAKPGDFFYIPAGTVHAIRKGTLILEIQQTSNLTYRLYDYDRLQDNKKRPLHLEKALDVITCPQAVTPLPPSPLQKGEDTAPSRVLLHNELFHIEELQIPGLLHGCPYLHTSPRFTAFVVLEGEGRVDYGRGRSSFLKTRSRDIKKGDVFVATAFCDTLTFRGAFRIVAVTLP